MAKTKLTLVVKTRDETLFEGEIESVTSVNEVGKFDVLSRHANFISLVGEVLEVKTSTGGVNRIDVNNGVLRVLGDRVEVYLGIKKEEGK